MKTFWMVLVTVIVAGGLAGGGTYYYLNKKTTDDENVLQSQINNLNTQVTTLSGQLATATTGSTATTGTIATTGSSSIITPTTSGSITLAKLQVASYTLDNTTYKLTNGSYKKGNIAVDLDTDHISIDNGNPTPDAAVIVKYNDGGTAVLKYLVIMKASGDTVQYVANQSLGDRVQINSIALKNDLISISELTFGPTDPSCCPSVAKTISYKLTASNKLVLQ